MELRTIKNGSPSALQILQSLSAKVKLANNLVEKCSTGAKSIRDDDLKFITEELEEVIRKLGQDLSTIPLSIFQNNKYAEITVQSLSREMKNVCFHINGTGNCITDEHKLENSSIEQLVKRKEADLVPSSDEKNILHSTWSGYEPRLGDFLDAWKYASGSIDTLSQIAEYSEPLYDTFFCPITKRIMDDPVTIESGITFERKAIAEWFGRFKDVSETITCPATGTKLQSRVLNSNIAIRTIIAEWKRRNEVKRIKIALNVLLLDKSEAMVLDAIRDLNILSQKRRYNREEMHILGITKLLTSFLEHKNMMVRTEALKLLRLLVKDQEGKIQMASYLSELILEHDMKTYVAEKAAKVLIKMVTNTHTIITHRAAFGALVQISSHPLNNQMLVNAGIIPILMEEMFACGVHDTYIDFKEQAATILANIAKSTIDLETIQVDKHGHTITSRYSIYNIARMLKCSKSDKLNINLIKILLYMAKIPKHIATVVSVIKETEVSYTLIEELNSPVEVLVVAAAKLLTALSSHIGHTIAEGLCKTQGQPEGLIKSYDIDQITKKHAISVNLIAKLPHKNLTLNLSLLRQGTVPAIISRMQGILRGESRTTRYTRCYLEGLVGVLVRLTATLFDQEILQMARGQNLTSVFTELLVRTAGSDEVQRLAAAGLENLSSQSVHLSRPPEVRNPSRRRFLSKSFSSSSQEAKKSQRVQLCPVHKGACSSSTTFCLLESGAVERLLSCLEQKNPEVVEAALSAVSTLLDERVDVEESVRVLGEGDALSFVLGALREHREEGVRHKCFLVIERFLMGGGDGIVGEISNDRMVCAALVTAVHKGSGSSKKMAENILRYLNNLPF
ncbi:hypothetical protein BHE74_00033357 [Ensete ventricosum]|nr:hypothetical protein GW17_00009283 [Ensete ventricosum]RWW59686.1 hypothetical protein BHE74_00033357 [Ensete ventricosum]RZS09825.1 hypothetical protein BHM03_00040943 [Ensete ventricosum]